MAPLQEHESTIVGLMLGLVASYSGTMQLTISKINNGASKEGSSNEQMDAMRLLDRNTNDKDSKHLVRSLNPFVMEMMARKQGYAMASNLLKALTITSPSSTSFRRFSGIVKSEITTTHTSTWMQDTSKKSPMELINEVPPIKVEGRIVACEGDTNPALGHSSCLDLNEPTVCKYCGLRCVQEKHH